jgi:hypothetical protein
MQCIYIRVFTIKALERLQYNFNLFYTFMTYVLYKYSCTLPEDDPQRVETCRSSSALIVKNLYYNTMCFVR